MLVYSFAVYKFPGAQVWLKERRWEDPPGGAPGFALPPGVTLEAVQEWCVRRQRGVANAPDRERIVDAYLAATKGARA